MFDIDLAPFDTDQVKLLLPAVELTQTGHIPPVGGSTFSVGVNIPPLITAILALPLVVSHSPVWIASCLAAVDGIGALLAYATVRQLSTPLAAAAAGLSYAVVPAIAVNARWVTNGTLVPFTCAVALWSLVAFLRTGSGWQLAAALLAVGLGIQLHLTVVIFLPVVAVAALLRWRDVRWRPLGLAVGITALTLAPYAYFQLTRGLPDVHAAAAFLGAPKQTSIAAFVVASAIVGGDIHSRFASTPLDAVGWLLVLVLLLGVVAACMKRQPAAALIVAWLALPVAAAIRHSETVAPHYFLDAYPAIAMLLGFGFAVLPLPPLRLILVAALVALRIGQWIGFQNELRQGNVPQDYPVPRPFSPEYDPLLRYSPPYGAPLRYSLQAVTSASEASHGQPVVVGPRQGYEQVIRFLSDGRLPVLGLRSDSSTLLPRAGAVLMLDGAGDGLDPPLPRFATPLGTVAPNGSRPLFSLFRLEDGWLDRFNAWLAPRPLDVDFGEAHVRLTAIAVPPLASGQTARLRLEWQMTEPPSPELTRLHVFVHAVDAAGKVWSASGDPPIFQGAQWGQGDSILSDLDVALEPAAPTGGYWLEIGLYELDTGRRVPVTDGGRPVGDQVHVGLLKVRGSVIPAARPARAIFGSREIGLSDVQVSGQDVVLAWSAMAKPGDDYTVFVHVLDADGRIIAQEDGPPAGGSYPTSLWDAGETVRDVHPVAGSLSGATTLEVGLYTSPDLRRLPAAGPDGSLAGDAIVVPWPR